MIRVCRDGLLGGEGMSQATNLEQVIAGYVEDYVSRNQAAMIVRDALEEIGIGLFPVVDHITVRTLSIDTRAEEFLEHGYRYSETLEYGDWWAKVYRAPGCPALRPPATCHTPFRC